MLDEKGKGIILETIANRLQNICHDYKDALETAFAETDLSEEEWGEIITFAKEVVDDGLAAIDFVLKYKLYPREIKAAFLTNMLTMSNLGMPHHVIETGNFEKAYAYVGSDAPDLDLKEESKWFIAKSLPIILDAEKQGIPVYSRDQIYKLLTSKKWLDLGKGESK